MENTTESLSSIRRRVGSLAGIKSASLLTPQQRQARSTRNGTTTLLRLGTAHFQAMGKKSAEARAAKKLHAV